MNRTPYSTKIAFASGLAFVTIFIVFAGASMPWARGYFNAGGHGGGGMAHQPMFHAQPAFHPMPAMFRASAPAFHGQPAFRGQPMYHAQQRFYSRPAMMHAVPQYQAQRGFYHARPAYQPQHSDRPHFAGPMPMRPQPGWYGGRHFAKAGFARFGGFDRHDGEHAPRVIYGQRHGGGFFAHRPDMRGDRRQMARYQARHGGEERLAMRHGHDGAGGRMQYAQNQRYAHGQRRYFAAQAGGAVDYGAAVFSPSEGGGGGYDAAPTRYDDGPLVQATYEAPLVATYVDSAQYAQSDAGYGDPVYAPQDEQVTSRRRSYRQRARVVYLDDPAANYQADYQDQTEAAPTRYCPPQRRYRQTISARY